VITRPTSGTDGSFNTITATLVSGDSKEVSTSQSDLPNGVSAEFSSSFWPTRTKNNKLTIDSSAPTGTFPVTITGTGGGLTRTTTYNLIIQESSVTPPIVPQFDFSLSNSGDIVITKSASGSGTGSNIITATLISGDTENVEIVQQGVPSNVGHASNWSGSPTFESTNNIAVINSTPLGTYLITVTGTGGGLTRTTSYNLIIKEPTPTEPEPIATKYSCNPSTEQCSIDTNGVYSSPHMDVMGGNIVISLILVLINVKLMKIVLTQPSIDVLLVVVA